MDRLAAFADEVAAMTAALRTVDPTADVTSCPGWTAADICRHVTAVHRWALAALDAASPPPYDEQPASADDYEVAGAALVERFRQLPGEMPCWTFNRADATVGFWLRRQLHEVSMHRWDLDQHALDPALAEDGIDEVVDFFLPRQLTLGRTTVPSGSLTLDSGTREWTLGDVESPSATVRADPATLHLLLWGRRKLGGIRAEGDMMWAQQFFEAAITP